MLFRTVLGYQSSLNLKMENELISILVPVYNVDKHLRACLDSLTIQSYQNIEIVLVDDGSCDDSAAICDEYAKKDSRIIVVHKKNEGVSKARITAFEHSHGELITFVDADDYVDACYVEKLAAPIINDGCDIVSCDYYNVCKGNIVKPRPKLVGTYSKSQIRTFIANHYFYDKKCNGYGMTIFLCTKMVKREYVGEALKQGLGMWFAEDQISVFHILQRCNKMCLIADRLYYYNQHEGQATRRYDESLWEGIITLMKRYEALDVDGMASKGIRQRTWRHINLTIFLKMAKMGFSYKDFENHFAKVRNHPFVDDFFKPLFIEFGIKENLKYWLLKFKRYRLFYFFVKRGQKKG